MKISTIEALRNYLVSNSSFSQTIINNVIIAMGYSLNGDEEELKDLSSELEDCAEHGADIGISGFIDHDETVAFFIKNRGNIVSHMEHAAKELGTDIISMVQKFCVFRDFEELNVSHIGQALWGDIQLEPENIELYHIFSWFTVEEVSQTWYRYLEDNPSYWAELSA